MLKKLFPLTIAFTAFAKDTHWSQIHKKIITQKEHREAQNKLVFEKTNIKPFNHTILSWNAQRPQAGFFVFEVQAHNANTGKWTSLYKAVEWGHGQQRSFLNKGTGPKDKDSHYVNIRLEMLNNTVADGFRVHCTAIQGSDISLVKMIAINALNTQQFKPEVITKKYKSIHIKNVPFKSQFLVQHPKFADLCSPTSTSLLVSYLTQTSQDVAQFANGAYDVGLQVYGSWPFNTAHAYEQAHGAYWFYVQRLNSWEEVYKKLLKKIPVVVSVRGSLKGAPKAFPGGHLLLVVGYDAKNNRVLCHDSSALFRYYDKETNSMICSDPSFLNEREAVTSYDFNDFIRAWERSFRTAYIAEPL